MDIAKKIIKDMEEESLYKKKKGLSEVTKAFIFMAIGAIVGILLFAL